MTNDINLLGHVHKMRIFGALPSVNDSAGTLITVNFTSDICQNAYIVSDPIENFAYDISYGVSRVITELNWESSDSECPHI